MVKQLALFFLLLAVPAFSQGVGGRGVPSPGGAVNRGGVPGGTGRDKAQQDGKAASDKAPEQTDRIAFAVLAGLLGSAIYYLLNALQAQALFFKRFVPMRFRRTELLRTLIFALFICVAPLWGQGVGGGGVPGGPGSGGSSLLSQKVVYTSKLAGVTGGVAVVPGSSATSTTDSAAALNTAIASGNVDLEVDSGYALSTSLVLASNTTIHCIAPQYGFIMQAASNASVLVNANQPTPLVSSKFTDGIHFIGPAQFLWVQGNRINAGDDSVALNADDGNRTGSGDVNASYVQAAVKWGPITDGHIDDNTLDAGYFGFRAYTATELIDRIEVTNFNGTICGTSNTLAALSALGNGNIGSINFTDWGVQSGNTCPGVGSYDMAISSNFGNISIDGLNLVNPPSTWPIIQQTAGAGNVLSLRNWNLNTPNTG